MEVTVYCAWSDRHAVMKALRCKTRSAAFTPEPYDGREETGAPFAGEIVRVVIRTEEA